MARRKESEELTKITLNVFARDYARLRVLYPPEIGPQRVIRALVRAFIQRVDAKATAEEVLVPELKLELEL